MERLRAIEKAIADADLIEQPSHVHLCAWEGPPPMLQPG